MRPPNRRRRRYPLGSEMHSGSQRQRLPGPPPTVDLDPFERAAIRTRRPVRPRSPMGPPFLNEAPQDYPSHLGPVPRAPAWEQVVPGPTPWSPLAPPPRATDCGRFVGGTECSVSEDGVNCITQGGRRVTFPRGGLRPGTRFAPGESDYYNIPDGPVRADPASIMQGVIDRPTRGPSGRVRRASPEGTPNEATPSVMYNTAVGLAQAAGPFGQPVIPPFTDVGRVRSYLTTDQTRAQVVVDVTEPGHPLYPGVVIRYVTESPSGATIWNEGTGRGWLQGPNGPAFVRDRFNDWVWEGQAREILDGQRPRSRRP
jgi:hypothetical protein